MGIYCEMRIQLSLVLLSAIDCKPVSEVSNHLFGDNFFDNLLTYNETGYNMTRYNATQDVLNSTGDQLGSFMEAILPSILQSVVTSVQPSDDQRAESNKKGIDNLMSKFEDLGKEYALNALKTGMAPEELLENISGMNEMFDDVSDNQQL